MGSRRRRGCKSCPRVRRAGPAQGACAGRGAGGRGRPRSLARAGLRGNELAGGGAGRAGRGGCYFCRFLFLAATSPWQRCYSPRPLPGSAGARDPGLPRPLVSHLLCSRSPPRRPPPPAPGPLPRAPVPPLSPPSRPALPVPAAREGGREIDGGRLLKNIVTVSVFITLTRERYLLLLFAEPASPERGRPPGSSPFGRSWEVAGGSGRRGLGQARGVGGRGPPGRWVRSSPSSPAGSPADPLAGSVCARRDRRGPVTRVEGERQQKKGTDDFILGKAPSYVDQFPGDCGGTAPLLLLEAPETKPHKDQKILSLA